MANKSCTSCAFRGRYEKNPKSFLGRLWRWHTGFCPGWKMYVKSLTEEERTALMAHLKELDAKRKG